MTAQTPVELWEPALARHSLPSGLPLTGQSGAGDLTHLDAGAISGLFSRADEVLWSADYHDVAFRACEMYLEDEPSFYSTSGVISPGILTASARIGPPTRSLSVRWIVQPPTPSTAARVAGRSSALIRESLERLRRDLRLSARAIANLIGLSTRRYYEFRAGNQLPTERLAAIGDRVDFIDRLATHDLPATADLFRRRGTEVADLLTQGRHSEVEELLRTTTRERATTLETVERPAISGSEATELLAVAEGVVFGKIMGLIRYLAPTVDARTPERVAAALRMEKNIDAVEEGNPVEDEWEFLLVMAPDKIAGLRNRGEALIRSEAFNNDTWATLVAEESGRAWAAFDYRPAPAEGPHLPEEMAAPDAARQATDLSTLGVDLSLYDRRAR